MKLSALRLAAALLAVAYAGERANANDFLSQPGGVVYGGAAPGYAGAGGIGYAGPGYGPGMTAGPAGSLFTNFPNYAPWGGYGYGNRHEKWGCCAGIWDGYCNQGSAGWGGGCPPRKVCHRRRALGRGAGPYIDGACCAGGNAMGAYGAAGYANAGYGGAGYANAGCGAGGCGVAAQPACGPKGCRLRQHIMQRRLARSCPAAVGCGYADGGAGYTMGDGAMGDGTMGGAPTVQQPQSAESVQAPSEDEPSPMPPDGNST